MALRIVAFEIDTDHRGVDYTVLQSIQHDSTMFDV